MDYKLGTLKVTCPHCGHVQKKNVELFGGNFIMECSDENSKIDRSCVKEFVVSFKMIPEVFTTKIVNSILGS